jgi:hypothetical protein
MYSSDLIRSTSNLTTRVYRPCADAEDEHDGREARAQDSDDGERQQDERERHHNVDERRDDPVNPAAEEAGQHAERDADDARDDRRQDADGECEPRSVHQAGGIVAADSVGAERVAPGAALPDWLLEPVGDATFGIGVRRQDRREDGDEDQNRQDDRAGNRHPEPPEGLHPLAKRFLARAARREYRGRVLNSRVCGGHDSSSSASAPDARIEDADHQIDAEIY